MAVELAFRRFAGEGPPVVILHGLFGSGRQWERVAKALSHWFDVWCPDLRNHGASPRRMDMGYETLAEDVLRFIEQQGLQRPALVGHSMGGKVAMTLALLEPMVVGPLVVLDIAPVSYADPWAHQMGLMRRLLDGRAPGVELVADQAGRLPAHQLLAQLMLPRHADHDPCYDLRTHLPAVGLALHELFAFPRRLRYLQNTRPLHAVVGAHSRCVPAEGAACFAPMFPHATLEVLDGAGHWLHADQPAALIRCLERALPRARGARRAAARSSSSRSPATPAKARASPAQAS